jgi:protein dithiol oxidoreductase (disulfide-forming)
MKSIVSFLRPAACMLAFLCCAVAAAQPVTGQDYTVINPPQPTASGKRVEVQEFFWYGCPHCYALQPPLRVWLKQKPADVDFRRVPAAFADHWIPLVWAYYAMDAMAIVDKLHYDVFDAIHEQRVNLSDPRVLFDWVAKQGVDGKKFAEIYHSFGVKSRGMRSIEMTRAYDIPGTPAIVVDGKYVVAPSMMLKPDKKSVDYDRYFLVLDQVIARARKERAAAQ